VGPCQGSGVAVLGAAGSRFAESCGVAAEGGQQRAGGGWCDRPGGFKGPEPGLLEGHERGAYGFRVLSGTTECDDCERGGVGPCGGA